LYSPDWQCVRPYDAACMNGPTPIHRGRRGTHQGRGRTWLYGVLSGCSEPARTPPPPVSSRRPGPWCRRSWSDLDVPEPAWLRAGDAYGAERGLRRAEWQALLLEQVRYLACARPGPVSRRVRRGCDPVGRVAVAQDSSPTLRCRSLHGEAADEVRQTRDHPVCPG